MSDDLMCHPGEAHSASLSDAPQCSIDAQPSLAIDKTENSFESVSIVSKSILNDTQSLSDITVPSSVEPVVDSAPPSEETIFAKEAEFFKEHPEIRQYSEPVQTCENTHFVMLCRFLNLFKPVLCLEWSFDELIDSMENPEVTPFCRSLCYKLFSLIGRKIICASVEKTFYKFWEDRAQLDCKFLFPLQINPIVNGDWSLTKPYQRLRLFRMVMNTVLGESHQIHKAIEQGNISFEQLHDGSIGIDQKGKIYWFISQNQDLTIFKLYREDEELNRFELLADNRMALESVAESLTTSVDASEVGVALKKEILLIINAEKSKSRLLRQQKALNRHLELSNWGVDDVKGRRTRKPVDYSAIGYDVEVDKEDPLHTKVHGVQDRSARLAARNANKNHLSDIEIQNFGLGPDSTNTEAGQEETSLKTMDLNFNTEFFEMDSMERHEKSLSTSLLESQAALKKPVSSTRTTRKKRIPYTFDPSPVRVTPASSDGKRRRAMTAKYAAYLDGKVEEEDMDAKTSYLPTMRRTLHGRVVKLPSRLQESPRVERHVYSTPSSLRTSYPSSAGPSTTQSAFISTIHEASFVPSSKVKPTFSQDILASSHQPFPNSSVQKMHWMNSSGLDTVPPSSSSDGVPCASRPTSFQIQKLPPRADFQNLYPVPVSPSVIPNHHFAVPTSFGTSTPLQYTHSHGLNASYQRSSYAPLNYPSHHFFLTQTSSMPISQEARVNGIIPQARLSSLTMNPNYGKSFQNLGDTRIASMPYPECVLPPFENQPVRPSETQNGLLYQPNTSSQPNPSDFPNRPTSMNELKNDF